MFLFKELLPLFSESRLRVLDVSDNLEVYIHPGITNSLPYFEQFSLNGNILRYLYEPAEASCFVAEGVLHQNIKVLDLRNLGSVGVDIDFQGSNFLRKATACLVGSLFSPNITCMCTTIQELCGAFIQRPINCSHIREFSLSELFNFTPVEQNPDRFCSRSGLQFPFPRRLEETRVANTQFNFLFGGWKNSTDCYAPNVMKKLDLSYITFNLAADSYHIIGWNKLQELNLSFSD